MTTVFLSDEDAPRFQDFLRYYAILAPLIDSHVLGISNGSITMHFGEGGMLMEIDTHMVAMKRKRGLNIP